MTKIIVLYILLVVLISRFDCEVYQDRPKIKTSNGDLILEPAYDKNIYLRPNGPKSSILIGEINLLNAKSKSDMIQNLPTFKNDIQDLVNGPNGILNRLRKLESNISSAVPDDLISNISMLWRKVNSLHRKVHSLQTQINNRGQDECRSDACQHGGTCLNLVNGYHCLCPNNWEGKNCDVDVNECRNFAGTDLGCQNGATCINKPGYYECLCKSGWFGLHCTRKAKDCSGGDFEMCGHGTCLKTDTGEGVTCICHQGWTTNGTGVACLTDVNECNSHQGARCSVNPKVECINLPGSFQCGNCPSGYEGDGYICVDVDECTTIANGGCSSMVACHNTIGSRICGPCPPGYEGDGVTCSWRGPCTINHGGCHPSAQCIENLSLVRTVQCVCPDGMTGDGIGIHGCYISTSNNSSQSCTNNPCGEHGQCHVLRSGYTCICQRGYGGSHCDFPSNLCAINQCQNGGICKIDDSTSTGFRCECSAQYSGSLCQIHSKTCGGVLDAEEGSIVYPVTNTTYIHNSKCAWVIHTMINKVINVTFSKFSLEQSPDCGYDFLQIHDGRSSASQLIGRFCGTTFPMGGNIISSHNNLYFWFRSDNSIAKHGFALHWTSVDPVCGGEIDATNHGRISSPGSPGKYPPNRDCYWILTTAFAKKLQLHFFALDIESHTNCSFDYLAIYDGRLKTDSLLSKYCNSTLPAPLLSAGSEILIHFHSDAYGNGNGFQIAYAPVPGVPGCGGYFTTDRGEITSPSFNGTYLNNVLCEYKIKTSLDTKIRIEFKQFNLEKSKTCRFDYLKLYDGPSEESPLVGKFCGTTYPKLYVASSNYLFLRFHSDNSLSGEGFKIFYEGICQLIFRGDSGVIKSPGYPFSYPENKVCEYLIITTHGKAIQLTFQDFDIEDNRYYNCRYDYVEIRDGADMNSTLLGRYCGGSDHIPPVQLSTHNYMYIRFNSDMSISGTGFYANYTNIDAECGGIYREPTGLINHPSGDTSLYKYKNDQSCSWILVAPAGMYVKLTWHRFEIENMPSCSSDYLELIEIDENNNNTNLGKFCGTKTPPAITTSTNRLKMKFVSDNSVTSSGFSVSYAFLDAKSHCGGVFYKNHGFIYSPGWPQTYEPNRDCTWVITVPVGQQIRLNISQFDLERPIRGLCKHGDFLEIRNGATQNSPLIGQYCGKFSSKIITSLANSLHLHFRSDYYLSGNGFRMEWDGSVFGCGGTLKSSTGYISSPNYPDSYYENAECFYRIVTSFGSRIRISFMDLELERTSNCRDDYVEIFDGRNTDANSLGKYCYTTIGLINIDTTSNYVFIKFRSDSYIGARGFLLNYITICNNNLTGRYGVIESPDYPDNYPLHLNCLWNITVPKGNKLNVTFTHFDIFKYAPHFRWYIRGSDKMISCDQHYIQWKEMMETKYSDQFCGMTPPAMISTKSNSLQIKFSTGGFSSKTGFRLEWVSYGCGGHIQKRYGSVSIDSSMISSDELECEWLIETPVGTSVDLIISDIYLTETSNCTKDYVNIYNGQNVNAPLLTTICHHRLTRVKATANFMLVQFIKHSTLKGAFFSSTFTSPKSTCGGRINSLSGFIYSKNYPKNYDNNLDCTWIISVPINHRIELNFIDLDLYSNEHEYPFEDIKNCDDSIKIFDNEHLNTDKNYTLICPDSNIKQIITKYNKIMVQFISDSIGNAKGFKANFSVTCGANIIAINDGIISNENYVGGPNKSCTWTILAAQPYQKISLTITHIFFPKHNEISSNRSCPSSYLQVYDGDDINAPFVDEYCGRKAPPMIVSRGSSITVLLGTYSNSMDGRFSAHYTSLNEACGGTLTSEEGSIASPNYPRSYPIGANCEWTLSTSPGNKVYITFEKFGLVYSEGCNEDYLEIRENNGAGQLLGVYCGTDIPTNTTTANTLFIIFHSDDKNSGQGFLLHYGFLHGNEFTDMEEGEIASPLYPHLYQGAAIYSWRIQSRGPEDITIIIDDLEIPSFGNVCNNYLSVYDGYDDTAPLLSKLCGKKTDLVDTINTSSNMVYIKLSLDNSNTGALFHLMWEKQNIDIDNAADNVQKINCGSNFTDLIPIGNVSILKSPNFPDTYDNDLNCIWTFQATKGHHLKLFFQEFELEETARCNADYINIYSSDTLGQWKTIKENVCETQTALGETNLTTYLKVQFKTDSSITKKGFFGQVSSLCGGILTDLSGEVGPVLDDFHVGSSFSYEMKCEWVIKVRPGRLINFRFTHFNISNTDENCFSSVTIRNGDSLEAPFLSSGKYCGYAHEKREEFTTSSNSLFITYINKFNRFSTRVFQNFVIRYEEKNVECGVTSKLDFDQSWEIIQSPNYPSIPVPFSECIWTFTGPPGEILRIDFVDRFDLDNVDDCMTEFVEVRDGSSILSPIKGRYCSEKPGTIKSSNNALYIRYLTQLSEPRNGFKANVSIDVCGGTIVAENGELKSPGYPNLNFIPYGSVCEWRIIGNPRFVFSILPQDIDLPESETQCATKVTIEEKVPENETTAVIKEFCEESELGEEPVETSSNEVFIKLYVGKPSDWSRRIESRGFRFTFNSSRLTCGGPLTTPLGFLTTPGYPLYTNQKRCSWYITVPDKTRRVRLELIDADLDKYMITMYNDNAFQSLIQTIGIGNSSSTRVYEASGNKMVIFLWVKQEVKRHRFKAKFSSYETALCGGDLAGLSGEVLTPNIERSYACEWRYNSKTIESEEFEYKSVLVTARVNSSTAKSRCRYSDPQLRIKATVTNEGLSFYRYLCGSIESTLRIPASVIDFKAVTGNSNSLSVRLGWKAQPCGGIINVDETARNVLNIPNNANDTLDCAWVVKTPINGKLEIKMEGSFQYSCDDEFIKINNNFARTQPTIGDYCKGKMLDNPLVISLNTLYIEYHTKATNLTSIKLMAKNVVNQCGGQFSFPNSVFSSPNYPKNYEPNQECSWLITTTLGNRISLKFIDRFVVEDRPNCTKDAVIIYDWKEDAYIEIARICGRQLPAPYNSTYNKMKVVLRTDATTNSNGFKATWTNICGGNYVATEKRQFLYSPNYPLEYPPQLDCTYKIYATNDKKVLIQFIEFELEGTYPNCKFDNVTLSGDDNSYNYFYDFSCGNRLPSIVSNYNQITIAFKSDRFVEKRGFKLSYQINQCGGEVKESTILSSHLGDNYDTNMNCTWFIEAPADKIILLKFLYIDIESHSTCNYDFVALYDDILIDEDRRLALMCGHHNSTVLRSNGNKALLQFVTDKSNNYKGFKVEVLFSYSKSVGCGGHFDLTPSSPKIFKSFTLPNKVVYENFLDCEWTITSPTDYIIKIEFTSFHVAPCVNVNQTAIGFSKCDCDFVEIKDGLNPDSFVIGKYCGHTLPPSLYTSGNLMSIRLSTDGELQSSGFDAQLTVQQSECGQTRFTIENVAIRLKSPGYNGGIIPRGLRCVYYFDASRHADFVIRLSILDLDLQPAYNQTGTKICNKDRLIVANNPVSQNLSMGKDYIFMNHAADEFIATNYYTYYEDAGIFPRQIEYCGSNKPSDLYVTGGITLTLTTSAESDSFTHKGFEIEVSFVGICGRSNYTGTQGKIQTIYSLRDDEDQINDCNTLITAPENHTISAYFLSANPDYYNTGIYLDIFDGNDTSANKLVSIKHDYETTLPVFSTGRYMLLHNHAEGNDFVSIDMNYVTTDKGRGCGGKLSTVLGRVTSPMYPDTYRNVSSCEWEMETPIGTRLKLHFDVFDLGRTCDQNYLQLVDSKGNVVSSYCSEKPADYTSPDNFVKIVFYTTMNNAGTGWVADFVSIRYFT